MSLILLRTPLSTTLPSGPPTATPRHARSATCESGTCRAGSVYYRLKITVNDVPIGVLVSSGFRINHIVGRASTCTFSTRIPVVEGQQVKVIDDGAHHLLFGGTVDTVTFRKQKDEPTIYDVACTDWIWLANKDTEIYEQFVNISANTALTRIIEYTDPGIGIMPGSIPESLGNITLTIDGSNFEQAVNDIARITKANWKLTAHRRLDVYQTEVPNGNALELADGSRVKLLGFKTQISQIRTRVVGIGGGSQTSGITSVGSTSILVKECGWYSPSGGFIKVSGIPPITYTGVTATSGLGSITGVSGLSRDLADNETINVYTVVNDISAQSDLATKLSGGGSLTGIATYRFSDQRLSLSTLVNKCQMFLDFYKTPIREASYAMGMPDFYYNAQRRYEIGRLIPVSIDTGSPVIGTIEGTLRLSELTIEGLADIVLQDDTGYSWETQRNILLRPGARKSIFDLMVQE
jgi:hypothetical protein